MGGKLISLKKKEKIFINIFFKLILFIIVFFFPLIVLAGEVGDATDNNNEIIDNTNNQTDCEIENFFFKKCRQKLDIDDEKTNFITNILIAMVNDSLNDVFNYVLNTDDIIVKEENETYHIFELHNQKMKENITFINFTNAYIHLIEKNYILPEVIFVFKIEHHIYPYQVPIIEFIFYSKIRGFFEFNNIKLDYYIPINNIDEDRLYIYDITSDYYKDECKAFKSPNGTDITMYSRKNEFNEFYLNVCDNGCTFKGYNSTFKKVICECISKTGFVSVNEIYKKVFFKFEDNEMQISNFFLLKCYYLISSLDDIRANPGFYILVFVMGFHVLMMLIFVIKGYSSLSQRIDEAIKMKFHPNNKVNEKNKKLIVIKVKNNNNNDNKLESGRIKRSRRNKTGKNMKNVKNGDKTDKRNSVRLKQYKNSNSGSKHNLVDNEQSDRNKKKKKSITSENDKKNDKNNETIYIFENDFEITMLPFEEAIKCDKRTRCDIYCSYLRSHQLFLFSFLDYNSYNSAIMKPVVFFLSFIYHYGFNACFFTDEILDKIYLEEGEYNMAELLPYALISSIISIVLIKLLVIFLLVSERDILSVKRERTEERAKEEKKNVIKCICLKIICFFFINILLLILFWFYLTCFNAVFPNTQTFLAINTVFSFAISNLLPLAIYAIPTFFRDDILSNKKLNNIKVKTSIEYKDAQYIYSISQYFQKF